MLGLEAVAMAPSLLVSLWYQDGAWGAMALTMALLVAVAAPMAWLTRTANPNLKARDGFVVVALTWVLISFFGGLPFQFSGVLPDLEDAFFESASGFTTTGASVLTNVEGLPRGLMFWRSFTHWIGGMGVLVLALALLPKLTGHTSHLMRAESPGPNLARLVPKLGQSAKILYLMYGGLTVLLILLLLAAGMPLYDALIHAFGTAGTGGFSNYNASVAAFHSPWIEGIITVFMVVFGTNFAVYYHVLSGGWRTALRDEELRVYLIIVLVSMGLVSLNIVPQYGGDVGEAIRYGSFQVSSVISTTGFATANFTTWRVFSRMLFVVLMLIGSCAGSTAGGLKVVRLVLLSKGTGRQLRQSLQARKVQVVKLDGKAVDEAMLSQVTLFFFTYIAFWIVGTLLISLENRYEIETNLTATLSCLSNIGPGLGAVGPVGNFSGYGPFAKAVLSVCMLAGRLEIFPMLMLLYPPTWRRRG